LIAAIEATTNATFNVRPMSWWFLKTFGQALALGRELSELEYLWRVPHRLDGTTLKSALGEMAHTPVSAAVAASLRALGHKV
jgi:hypothetical protein